MTRTLVRDETKAPKPGSQIRKPIAPKPSRGLAALDELVHAYSFSQVQQAAARGQSVIWGGWSWESPLIYACDTLPAAYYELWVNGSREAETVAEDHFQVPSEFCSMIKAMLGRLHLDKDNRIKRILHFGSGCEPISAILELAKADGYDVETIDTVSSFRAEDKRESGVAFLVEELRRIAMWLTGKPVDEDRVRREIHRKNTILRKVDQVLELRTRRPLYVDGTQAQRIYLGSMHAFGKPDAFIAALDLLIEEMEQIEPDESPTYIPVVLAGGVGNVRILQAIEESNGAIVGWVYHGADLYSEELPPLEALAHYVLDAQARGDLGEAVGSSVAYRRDLVVDEVRRTGARGVISSSITGCPYASLMQQLESDHMRDLGIPLIGIETDVHREPPTEEQIMRIKAFVEMLS